MDAGAPLIDERQASTRWVQTILRNQLQRAKVWWPGVMSIEQRSGAAAPSAQAQPPPPPPAPASREAVRTGTRIGGGAKARHRARYAVASAR